MSAAGYRRGDERRPLLVLNPTGFPTMDKEPYLWLPLYGHAPKLLATETLPYRVCVFAYRFVGKADEDRNSDKQ